MHCEFIFFRYNMLSFILSSTSVMKISNKVNGYKNIPKYEVHLVNITAYFPTLNLHKLKI